MKSLKAGPFSAPSSPPLSSARILQASLPTAEPITQVTTAHHRQVYNKEQVSNTSTSPNQLASPPESTMKITASFVAAAVS